MVKVSVVIPVYNVEKYLKQCLDSVLNQSFKNMEIICVEDCSTDASHDILCQYAIADARIKLIEHDVNRGLSAARNTGLRHAQGKYVYFLDSDDMILPETIEELFENAERNALDITYLDTVFLYDEGFGKTRRRQKEKCVIYEGIYEGQNMFANFWRDDTAKIAVWQQFYRADFLKENNLWFYEGIVHEDALFSFYCAMAAKRVMDINRCYHRYRARSGSITSSVNYHRAESMFIVMMDLYMYLKTHVVPKDVEEAIVKYMEYVNYNFQYYYSCCEDKGKLTIGSNADKCLYSLLFCPEKKYASITEEKIEKIRKASNVIIYGAGRAANEVIQILTEHNIHIDGIAVSEVKENCLHLRGIEVRNITEYLKYKNDVVVIVGVTKQYSDEIKSKLCQMGFCHIIMLDDVVNN